MIDAVRRWLAGRGGGRTVTVPPMDGILGPNRAIEEAPLVLSVEAPDNLVGDGRRILFSSGCDVMQLNSGGPGGGTAAHVARFDRPVASLAIDPAGGLAAGLEDGPVLLSGGRHDGRRIEMLGARPVICPTALHFATANVLLVALGSQRNPPWRWHHDLLQHGASGSVWRVDLASGEEACLADGLAWPAGLQPSAGVVVVSESWRNRLVGLAAGRRPSVELADVTGYPGRLAKAASGTGAWLSVVAPRSQLVEFVLREDDFRRSMMAEIDPRFWIAPSLSAGRSFLEPMQFGGLKQLGMLKAWAPTRSYGLVVGLDGAWQPRASFHSRSDGTRHGITSSLETDGRLLATSRGGNAIVSIPLDAGEIGP